MTPNARPSSIPRRPLLSSGPLQAGLPLEAALTRERLKVVLLFITIPPRLVLALVFLLLLALSSYIATLNWPDDQPLAGWRYSLMQFSRHFALWTAYLMGFWVDIKGWDNYERALKDGVRIAVFNHVSYVDAFVLVGLMCCSGLSKESNKKLPILGVCIKGLQNIYLPDQRQIVKDRNGEGQTESRADSVSALITKRAEDPRYPMLALAPEGTCGSGYSLLQFRTGAFVSGAPVLPVLLKYDASCINPAWTIIHEPMHFVRLLCQFWNKVEVTFLDPYYPSDAEKYDPTIYAEDVRMLMARELRVPCVRESYNHFYGLSKLGVTVAWDGKTITAPPGVIDADGYVDLTPVLDKKIS